MKKKGHRKNRGEVINMPMPVMKIAETTMHTYEKILIPKKESIDNLRKRKLQNIRKLESFKLLKSGWNGYASKPIDHALIRTVKLLVRQLNVQPEIFPTGRGSIQLEYSRDDSGYLEFEIFANNMVKMYIDTQEFEKETNISIFDIPKQVMSFYVDI